jgi:hypothetical protein
MLESVGQHSMIATDLLRGLPAAFRSAQQEAQKRFVCWRG